QAAPDASDVPALKPIETLDLTPADRLVLARLDKAMNENEVWRGEDLSIGTLAALVGAPEHRLRKLINGTLGHRNFADYVNGRRIEAAKVALADPEQALKSVSTIAYELGFASLGPFNRAFRAATGATPTAWRQDTTPAHPHLRLVETGEGAPKPDKRA
ncbi:MAG TPA: AraC family transcriptional regulator, partial [Caulobacter sp.]|nr:AraC family transcriptional regulator [Caulobacter sp.]